MPLFSITFAHVHRRSVVAE